MLVRVFYKIAGPEGVPKNNDAESRVRDSLARLNNPERLNDVEKIKLMRELGQDQLILSGKVRGGKAQEILEKRSKFEDVKEVDLLALKNNKIPLFEYLLVSKTPKLSPVKEADLKEGEEFIVNFGNNKYMRDSVGAGDILPQEIVEISINGKIGRRDNIGGRPGYYMLEGKKWIYRPIYDGDTIKVLKRSALSEEQRTSNEKTELAYYQRKVSEDILRSRRLGKDPRGELSYLSDEDFSTGESFANQIEKEREEELRNQPKTNSEESFLLYYGRYLDSICQQLNVPQEVMMAIFRKETSGFNQNSKNSSSGAHGIGQILDTTWSEIQDKLLKKYGFHGKILDRNNIKDQILAATVYLRSTSDERGSIEGGIMRYFGVSWSNIETAKSQNPAVYNEMIRNNIEPSPRGFEQAYVIWLGLKPGAIVQNYDEKWKEKLVPGDVLDGGGLPYGYNQTIGKDGSTWCGMTARLNAEKFGVIFPPIYNSSQALTQYGSSNRVVSNDWNTALREAENKKSNVVDIVFENTKGSSMGHRACGVLGKDGKWYVYDPYFDLGRNERRTAISIETYMQNMLHSQGKKLVGMGLHSSDFPGLKN